MDLTYLVTLAVNGDEQAKSELLVRAARLVYARVFRRIGSGSAAEDVAQDTLVALLTGLPRLRNPQAFLPWLRRITDNVVVDYFERRGNARDEVGHAIEDVPSVDDRADRVLERREERNMVQAALCALPPRSRLAIELFYFHDLTSREVADFLRISDDAARATLSRSRKELRRRMMTMTSIDRPESCIRFSFVNGESMRVRGPLFEHDSDTAKLYLALYPSGNANEAAASIGLSPERAQEELRRLEDMRLIVPQQDGWRGTMPVVSETDRELIQVWGEPIVGVVVRRLESLYAEAAALTVMIMWLIEAASRPFRALRGQMDVSAPDRGDFGTFSTGAFTFGMPGHEVFSGRFSSSQASPEDEGGENYLYYVHPSQTRRPGIEKLEQAFATRPMSILGRLVDVVHDAITDEMRAGIADELEIASERRDELWDRLIDLNAVEERDGRLRVVVPTLPLGPWKECLSLLEEIGEEINETIADAADDLRKRAARCSFADCYFSDSVSVFFAYLEGMAKQAIGVRQWVVLSEEADFSWGSLIVV